VSLCGRLKLFVVGTFFEFPIVEGIDASKSSAKQGSSKVASVREDIDVAESTSVSILYVASRRFGCNEDMSFSPRRSEIRRLRAITLNRLTRIVSLRRIDSKKPHSDRASAIVLSDLECVSIDCTNYSSRNSKRRGRLQDGSIRRLALIARAR